MNNFGDRLRAARVKRGLSQGKVGELLKVSSATVSHYETGAKRPLFDNFVRLCLILNVSADCLLGLESKGGLLQKSDLDVVERRRGGRSRGRPRNGAREDWIRTFVAAGIGCAEVHDEVDYAFDVWNQLEDRFDIERAAAARRDG